MEAARWSAISEHLNSTLNFGQEAKRRLPEAPPQVSHKGGGMVGVHMPWHQSKTLPATELCHLLDILPITPPLILFRTHTHECGIEG